MHSFQLFSNGRESVWIEIKIKFIPPSEVYNRLIIIKLSSVLNQNMKLKTKQILYTIQLELVQNRDLAHN